MPIARSCLRSGRGSILAACQMLILVNSDLRVELIDPAPDQARLGPRFSWGGYIWQVHDLRAGALLTGPEWPVAEPDPHNGQGLPESFRHNTTTGEPLLWEGDLGLAPGAGALGRDPSGKVVVTEPCAWTIDRSPDRAVFRTKQTVGPWSYQIERTIELRGRTVLSKSRIANLGSTPLKLQWFAHPYFALKSDGLLDVILPEGTTLPTNPGFVLDGRHLTLRRAFDGKDDGDLEHLALPAGAPLTAELSHPRISGVRFSTDFAPFKCVLWANGNTLSLEPFLALDIAPGDSMEWVLTYEFGAPN